MSRCASFELTFIDESPLELQFAGGEGFSIEYGGITVRDSKPTYHGEYNFTPSAEVQTVPTAGMNLEEDIVIGAIPNNYGLITWNGSTITVS